MKTLRPRTVILDGMEGLFPGGSYYDTTVRLNFDYLQNILCTADTLVIVMQVYSHLYPHPTATPYHSSYMQAISKGLKEVVVVHYPRPVPRYPADTNRLDKMEEAVIQEYAEFASQVEARVTFAHVIPECSQEVGNEKICRMEGGIRSAIWNFTAGKELQGKMENI